MKQALALDLQNGNTEIDSLLGFDTFVDKGTIPFLEGYQNIIVHFFLMSNMIYATRLAW